MCCHLVLFCHLPLSTSLLFWGVVEELLLLVVGEFIVLGSGMAGLSVPCPHAHSTHDCLHSTLTRPSILPMAHSLLGLFVPHRGLFIFLTQRSVMFSSCTGSGSAGSHIARRGDAFQWPFTFSTEWNRVCFPLFFVVWCKFPHAQTIWGRFPML